MKIIQIGKKYRATTRYFLGEKGCLEQQTKLYDPKIGAHVQTIFATKHGKVKVTSTGLIIRYKFNRYKMDTRAMMKSIREEEPVIMAFLNSQIGKHSIALAEKELWRINQEGGEL